MATLQPGRDGRIGRYLRTNDKNWSPPSVISFDTEAYRIRHEYGEKQPLRLWCARLDDRHKTSKVKAGTAKERGKTGPELAALIDKWSHARENMWLYAHNLGYDLVTSNLVDHMSGSGWKVEKCSTVPEYLFITLGNGRRRLTMTDLHHLLPAGLEEIGALLEHYKVGLPADDAPDDEWYERCERDTDILAEALLILMQHWDDYALGNWAISGAACGFRAMRHTIPKKSITLIDDAEGSRNERNAIYGGRRYVWRHGEQSRGRYAELDFSNAHATVVANYPMPAKRGTWFSSLDPYHRALVGDLAVIVAECEIQTDVPRFPCRINDRVWFPVGKFKTTLATPEIRWARDLGCLLGIGRGQFHFTSKVMQPFFRRVLDISRPDNESFSPLVRAMWKQWGRSVVGKTGQRGYDIQDTRMLTHRNWYYEHARDDQTGEDYWLVHYGGRIWSAKPAGDGPSAYPAILALVESYERVAIGQAAELLGPAVILQCDTDGIWCDIGALEAGAATGLPGYVSELSRGTRVDLAVALVNEHLGALQLREKHAVDRIAMWGPQNYDAGAYSRHSGRPARLKEVKPGVWAGDIFPSVARQMKMDSMGAYQIETVTWTRPACVVPGWVTQDGTVKPIEVTTGSDGKPQITHYSETRYAAGGLQLKPVQHNALAGLWDPDADYVGRAHV